MKYKIGDLTIHGYPILERRKTKMGFTRYVFMYYKRNKREALEELERLNNKP